MRNSIPSYLITNAGTLLENFNSADGYDHQELLSLDTVNYIEGTNGLKITGVTTGGSPGCKKTVSFDFKDARNILIKLFVYDITKITGVYIYFTTNNWGNDAYKSIAASELRNGWNYFLFALSDFSIDGNFTWLSTINGMKIRIDQVTGQIGSVTWGGLYINHTMKPEIMITFDDGRDQVFTNAYPIMRDYGIKGTAYINSTLIGSTNYMTNAQLDELYAAGWDISNHTPGHTLLTSVPLITAESAIKGGIDDLLARGYERSAYHIAYPGGGHNDDVVRISHELGNKTGRIAGGGGQVTPPESLHKLKADPVYATATAANVKAGVNVRMLYPRSTFYLTHGVSDSPGTYDCYTSVFQALIERIASSKIETLTVSEWYQKVHNWRVK